jgi:hypothetical protein
VPHSEKTEAGRTAGPRSGPFRDLRARGIRFRGFRACAKIELRTDDKEARMEEERKTRRAPVLVALAGVLLLAAVWATMALAGGSSPASKPGKAPAAKAQVSKVKAKANVAGTHGDGQCPFEQGASNDL